MNSIKEYIKELELQLLWVFNGETYYEDSLGKIISLKQIEINFFNSLK